MLDLAPPEEPGARLVLLGSVLDRKGRPVAGARIHAYQADAAGRYTPEKPMDEPHARLSGWLTTDARGRFELRTIRPGGYPEPRFLGGRERRIPAHVHLDVSAPGYAPRKLQAVFDDDPLLGDPYWKAWVERSGHPLLALRPGGAAATASLEIRLEPLDPVSR